MGRLPAVARHGSPELHRDDDAVLQKPVHRRDVAVNVDAPDVPILNGPRQFEVTRGNVENVDTMMNFELFEFGKKCMSCMDIVPHRLSQLLLILELDLHAVPMVVGGEDHLVLAGATTCICRTLANISCDASVDEALGE